MQRRLELSFLVFQRALSPAQVVQFCFQFAYDHCIAIQLDALLGFRSPVLNRSGGTLV
jgi:hypothetical protein